MKTDYLTPVGDSAGQYEPGPSGFSAIPPNSISFETLSKIFPDRDFDRFIFPLWVKLRDNWFRQNINNSSITTLPDALSPLLSQHLQEKSPAQIIYPDEVSRLCQAFQDAGIYQVKISPTLPAMVHKPPCQGVALNA